MGFAIHSHESAMGVHLFPILNPPSHLLPHPIPQGHPSAPALSTLSHVPDLDWRSVSHMVIYMFQCYSIKSSHPPSPTESKRLFFTSVSLAVSQIGSWSLLPCYHLTDPWTLPRMCEHLFDKMDPTTEAYGYMSTVIMG